MASIEIQRYLLYIYIHITLFCFLTKRTLLPFLEIKKIAKESWKPRASSWGSALSLSLSERLSEWYLNLSSWSLKRLTGIRNVLILRNYIASYVFQVVNMNYRCFSGSWVFSFICNIKQFQRTTYGPVHQEPNFCCAFGWYHRHSTSTGDKPRNFN